MTNYVYAGEMHELCFKISQAFKVLGERGLHDFYSAASIGYDAMQESMSVAEAGLIITKSQEETLESTAAYYKEITKEACAKLDQEVQK
jgi:hypothetical protein